MIKDKILIVDIETTGFLRQGGLIVEIGIVELNLKTSEKRVVYNQLVKEDSFNEVHKNAWIFSNSNLTFEDIEKAKPLDTFALQCLFTQYHATAYNKRFDFDFLTDRGLKIKELACPMLILTDVCKMPGRYGKFKWPKVQEAYDFLFPDREYIEKHRGCDDAMHEADLVFYLQEYEIHDYIEAQQK
jgi:DNA polymerase-3 subunit epsilon